MSVPIPSTNIFLESLRLSAKQRVVLDVIHQFPSGARVPDIATALGIHVNTARGHINELEEKGAIKRVKVRPTGPGRPYIVYKPRTPDNRLVAHEYVTLINALCSQLNTLSENPQLTAEIVGRMWAEGAVPAPAHSAEDPIDIVMEKFQLLGFDPTKDECDTIRFSSCPFATTNGTVNPLVCAIHQSMLQEAGHTLGLSLKLTPLADNGTCRVAVSAAPKRNDAHQ